MKKVFISDTFCQPCLSTCKTCNESKDRCTSCHEGYYLYDIDNKCYSTCPDGYVGVGHKCRKCHSPCLKCIINQDTCTDCISTYHLHKRKNKCHYSCPEGTFLSNNQCFECHNNCSTCSIYPEHCETCKYGFKFLNHQCFNRCSEFNKINEGIGI